MVAPIKPGLLLDIKISTVVKLMGTNGRADTASINHGGKEQRGPSTRLFFLFSNLSREVAH